MGPVGPVIAAGIVRDGRPDEGVLTIIGDQPWRLRFTLEDGLRVTAEGADLCAAFRALRRWLDPMGSRVLLAGTRRDAWRCPAGSPRSLSRVALLRPGVPAGDAETEWMFASAPAETVASVDEQDRAYSLWLTSLG